MTGTTGDCRIYINEEPPPDVVTCPVCGATTTDVESVCCGHGDYRPVARPPWVEFQDPWPVSVCPGCAADYKAYMKAKERHSVAESKFYLAREREVQRDVERAMEAWHAEHPEPKPPRRAR